MKEFVKSVNGKLLGAYGNFVNRTLTFIYKYLDASVPEGQLPPSIQGGLPVLFARTGRLIAEGRLKKALKQLLSEVRKANKYFDDRKPWITRNTDPVSCCNTLYTCVQLIANFSALLAPFLPFSSEKIGSWLGTDSNWMVQSVPSGRILPEPEVLFTRLEYSPESDD